MERGPATYDTYPHLRIVEVICLGHVSEACYGSTASIVEQVYAGGLRATSVRISPCLPPHFTSFDPPVNNSAK